MKAVNVDEVLKILNKYGKYIFITDMKKYYSMVDEIANLKALEQEPKIGHWIFDEVLDRHYYCSECKSMGVDYWEYCPNCGAKMSERDME